MGYFRRELRRGVCLAEKARAARDMPPELREWVAMSESPPSRKSNWYVRLAVIDLNESSHQHSGVFAATYALLDSGRLTEREITHFDFALVWFHDNLRIPRTVTSPRAIFWFKSGATLCIEVLWGMARLLRVHGIDV